MEEGPVADEVQAVAGASEVAARPVAAEPVLDALVEQVRAAAADGRHLRICGGGTKVFYGEDAPAGLDEEPLEVASLRGISAYEPSELVVTVRAGTPLAELEAELAHAGQWLPFEPPHFAPGGTVGGMVAAGLSGPARASAGSVRDYVLGATLLNGRAELLSFGGQVMKNVAGYDVSRLLAGSLGMFGVICEVSLKVLPQPVARRTLRFELDEEQALLRLNAWGGQPLPLQASAWWQGTLVLRLAGAQAAVAAAHERMGGEEVEPALAEHFWTGLRDHTDEYYTAAVQAVAQGSRLWRLGVPSTCAPLGLAGSTLIEWGGAQRWLLTDAPAQAVRAAARAAGGHATVWRGDKDCGAFDELAPPLARIHRELKQAFDPKQLFNRGRLVRGL
jgi:glycolate oxidase FAD binding subunit